MERELFEKVTNEAINILARAYAKEHSNAPDNDCPEWIIHDYEAGAYEIRRILTGYINLTDNGVKKITEFAQILTDKSICVNCDELKSCSNICMDCITKIVEENQQLTPKLTKAKPIYKELNLE